MTINNPSELLSRPVVDLLEAPLADFGRLLRLADLPNDEQLAELARIVAFKVVRILTRIHDADALRAEADAIVRMIPVEREVELDAPPRRWASRWKQLAELLDLAAENLTSRDPKRALSMAHAGRLLDAIKRQPGLTQVELGGRVGLGAANLSRILGVLEANGLLRRGVSGREKRVFPLADAVESQPSQRPKQGRDLFVPSLAVH